MSEKAESLVSIIKRLEAQNKILLEAVEFYANGKESSLGDCPASEALEKIKQLEN